MNNNIDYQNRQVLYLIQALLGVISNNMKAISVEFSGQEVTIHFFLENENPHDREEINDFGAEYEALQERSVHYEISTHIVKNQKEYLELPGRVIYLKRLDEIN